MARKSLPIESMLTLSNSNVGSRFRHQLPWVLGTAVLAAGALLLSGVSWVGQAHPDEFSTVIDPSPDPTLCRVEAGEPNEVSDDRFYLSMDGPDNVIEATDIRLVAGDPWTPGAVVLVGDADQGAAAECHGTTTIWFDIDSNARFSESDAMVIGYNRNTERLLEGTSCEGDWWIRVTSSGNLQPGTVVRTADSDFTSYLYLSPLLVGSEIVMVDFNANGAFDAEDGAYATSRAVETGDPIPNLSVRLAGPGGPFGSKYDAPDTTPPTVLILAPDLTAWQGGFVDVVARVTDAESALSIPELRVGVSGLAPPTASAPPLFAWRLDTLILPDGGNSLQVKARDAAGNVGQAFSVLQVDNRPPDVVITEPDDGDIVLASTTVKAFAVDAHSGVERVEFLVDGDLRAVDTDAPYEWTWEALLEPGPHTVSARALDVLGNLAETSVDVIAV